jgi:ketosteroid isomerase-like protein
VRKFNVHNQEKNMSPSTKTKIQQCEERLKAAMLQSDVSALDELLAADLLFTNHLGQLMSKQDDLNAHRCGMLKIDNIEISEQRLKMLDNVAVVSVRARIRGSFAGESSESDFRFTRIWHKTSNGNWQVTAAHSSIIA